MNYSESNHLNPPGTQGMTTQYTNLGVFVFFAVIVSFESKNEHKEH